MTGLKVLDVLESISKHLNPEERSQLNDLTNRQQRQIALLADERPDGHKWAAENFSWLRLVIIRHVQSNPAS